MYKTEKNYDELKQLFRDYLQVQAKRCALKEPQKPARRIIKSDEDIRITQQENDDYETKLAVYKVEKEALSDAERRASHALQFGGLIANLDYQFDIDGTLYRVFVYSNMGPQLTIEKWADYEHWLKKHSDRQGEED